MNALQEAVLIWVGSQSENSGSGEVLVGNSEFQQIRNGLAQPGNADNKQLDDAVRRLVKDGYLAMVQVGDPAQAEAHVVEVAPNGAAELRRLAKDARAAEVTAREVVGSTVPGIREMEQLLRLTDSTGPAAEKAPRFQIEGSLGDGRTADVYRARDKMLDREVAVKFIKPEAAGSTDALTQAKALARVRHQNVGPVFDVTEVTHPDTGERTPAIIMELINGQHLDELLAVGPLAREMARRVGTGILDGLEAIHMAGLHHLDLHEENILVVDDFVRIVDIHYLSSLAFVSTIPREKRLRHDFNMLFGNLARILKCAECSPRPVNDLHDAEVFDIERVRQAFLSALETPSEAMPREPQVLQLRERLAAFEDAISNERRTTRATASAFLDELLKVLARSQIQADPDAPRDDAVVESIRAFKPNRDLFVEFIRLISLHGGEQGYHELVVQFFEEALGFLTPSDYEDWGDGKRDTYVFVLHELFLYLTAVLIKARDYDGLDLFLEREYFLTRRTRMRSDGYCRFQNHNRTLDDVRKARLKSRRFSISADLMKEANNEQVPFERIVEADFLLCIRSLITRQPAEMTWFPSLLIYGGFAEDQGFEVFFRAKSKTGFENLKRLLAVSGKTDLLQRFEQAYEDYKLIRWSAGDRRISWRELMNLEDLYEADR